MKSTLLKTLAAASLVATSHGQIHVMGASWKERGVSAPNGDIEPNPGTVAAPRAYLILDSTVRTATPNAATYIEYGERRGGGVIDRYYTINSDFRAFLADSVFGDSGGRRLYGHMHVPLTISTVANPMIPFSGTTFSTDYPRKISFDQTVFQSGASSTATGPQIVLANSSTLRSVMSGSANPVKVSATTVPLASDELVARLYRQGYSREVGEAPAFKTDLDAALTLQDGEQATLTVELTADSLPGAIPGTSDPVEFDDFPAPTFQWYKNDVAIVGAVTASFTVTGGAAATGAGSYKVVATNNIGSTTSTTTVVTAEATTLAAITAPATLIAASSATLETTLTPTPLPNATVTYQWVKSPTGVAGSFVNVSSAFGGNNPKLVVIGGETPPAQPPGQIATGAGFYRLDVTTSAGVASTNVVNVAVNATVGTNFVFTTNSPRAVTPTFTTPVTLAPVVNTNAVPAAASATRQWHKATLANPTVFTPIAAGDGGNTNNLSVSGDNNAVNGPGVYRLVVTSTVAPITTITSIDTVVTTGS
jgi:hypothetical protein